MITLRRRHLLTGVPWLSLGLPLHAKTATMTRSTQAQQSEVQVGAGTEAGTTKGSSGPSKPNKPEAEPASGQTPAPR